MIYSSGAEVEQILIQKIGEAQARIQKSLHHQRRCHLRLAARSEPAGGRAEACGLAAEGRSMSVECDVLPKGQKQEEVLYVYVRVCVGLVHQRVLLALLPPEMQATEA
jgi:hypothetical protein